MAKIGGMTDMRAKDSKARRRLYCVADAYRVFYVKKVRAKSPKEAIRISMSDGREWDGGEPFDQSTGEDMRVYKIKEE